MKAEIIDHLDYAGGDNLAFYPKYPIGSIHDVTDTAKGEYELNDDIWVSANEIKIIEE